MEVQIGPAYGDPGGLEGKAELLIAEGQR
jgi:hypothetical protein